eukprot:4457384-Prymnesium_polylepis.1
MSEVPQRTRRFLLLRVGAVARHATTTAMPPASRIATFYTLFSSLSARYHSAAAASSFCAS